MITNKKKNQINVFVGSPWEVASVKNLLSAAYIDVFEKDDRLDAISLSVSSEAYTAAMRVIYNRKSA
ncbi:MAG: hypothetical protein EOM31_03400 [Bacteroidia bacterium]|nr:hypothetical protein [Bacteroidia bacterium]